MLPSWFDLISMSTRLAYQGKEYEGRTLQGAELHLLVDRFGRRCYGIYAMKRDARPAAGCIHHTTMRPSATEYRKTLQECQNSHSVVSADELRT